MDITLPVTALRQVTNKCTTRAIYPPTIIWMGGKSSAARIESKNGIYGKHGTTQSPPIPYQGKLYFLKGNSLIAFSPNGSNPKTPLPLATSVSPSSSSTTPSKAELTQRLETEIQNMIAAGPLRPAYHAQGFMDIYGNGNYVDDDREFGEIFDYFQNPADTVYTMLLAYPYLSANTQGQVKTYLQDYYGPGKTYDIRNIVHIGWGTGSPRELLVIPKEVSDLWGKNYESPYNPSTQPNCGWCGYWEYYPPFSFYSAWKYAIIVNNNDQASAKSLFDSIKSKLEAPLRDSILIKRPYWLNQYIAGYKGYLELQQLAGYSQSQSVLSTYQHLLDLRINNFTKDTPFPPIGSNSGGTAGVVYNNALSVARNFMFLVPEVADYMNQHILSQVQTAMNEYTEVAPYWFVQMFDDFMEKAHSSIYTTLRLFSRLKPGS